MHAAANEDQVVSVPVIGRSIVVVVEGHTFYNVQIKGKFYAKHYGQNRTE